MLTERVDRRRLASFAKKGARAALVPMVPIAAALTPDALPTPKFFSNDIPTASAEELTKNSEQQLDPQEQLILDIAGMFESKDLGKIGANLYAGRSYWKVYGEQFPSTVRSASTMVELFAKSFKDRGTPKCLGYMSTGPNNKYLGVVFENFGALSSNGVSGSSMVVIGVDPRIDDYKNDPLRTNRIYWVDEILSKDLGNIKRLVKPCPGKAPEPKPAPKPASELKPTPKEIPNIPKAKILFVTDEGGKRGIYISNPDGSDKKVLIENNFAGDPKWVDQKRFVYPLMGPMYGLFLYDTETGKEVQLTEGSIKGDIKVDMCSAPNNKGGLVFSRYMNSLGMGKNPSEDIYKVDMDGKNLEQLTRDTTGSTEHCPVVSPDGKFIAFRIYSPGRPGEPDGLVIYPMDSLKREFDSQKHPLFIDEGLDAIGWSPDGEWLLFTQQVQLPPPRGYRFDLYKMKSDGTGQSLVVKDAEGGSWSPDGKWVIFSSRAQDEKNLDLYIVSADGGEPTKITNTPYHESSPTWQPEAKRVWTQRDIQIVFGLITEIKDGRETHGLTRNFENWATTEYGYTNANILRNSWEGGEFDGNGNYKTRDQLCTDTLIDPNLRADMLIKTWQSWETRRSDRKLVVVTQSEGVVPTFLALQKIMKGEAKVDLARFEKFVFVSPPAHGVRKPIFDKLAKIWPVEQPENCRILFGATPPPSILEYPTGANLLKMWENRKTVDKEWAELTAWLGKKDVKVYSLYNYEDGIISFRTLPVPREVLEILLFKGKLTEVVESQEIPGAINIGRFLGKKEGFGHTVYWNTPEGLEILMGVIGEQIKRTGEDPNAILWEARRELFVRLNRQVLFSRHG